MIRVGMMGGIGSGKSFIAKLFKYPVFNADAQVKLIYRNDKNCYKKLKKELPKFVKSFPISKSELTFAINKNSKNLKKIGSVIHPIVRKKMKNFLEKNKNHKMVILDIPLLIENKLNKKGDILVYVKSDKNTVLKRLKKRRNFNIKLIKSLRDNQDLLLKKRKLSNYTVENNFSPNIMKKKIKILKKKILYERNSS
tara:strand:+ start:1381 stop:1968 length:588 start_codon:yes stop_codon:yes gene_type:complete